MRKGTLAMNGSTVEERMKRLGRELDWAGDVRVVARELAQRLDELSEIVCAQQQQLDMQARWIADLLHERPTPPRPREQMAMFNEEAIS